MSVMSGKVDLWAIYLKELEKRGRLAQDSKLWKVSAKNFVAGCESLSNGAIYRCAPILAAWCRGRTVAKLRELCDKKNWTLEEIPYESLNKPGPRRRATIPTGLSIRFGGKGP